MVLRTGDVDNVTEMAVSPNGQWYATVAAGGIATIWRATDGFEFRSFPAGKGFVSTISIASDGRTLASAYDDEIRLFDVRTANQSGTIKIGDGWNIARVAFHPSRMLIASLDINGTVRVRDVATNKELFHRQTDAGLGKGILHFSPDGRLLAVLSSGTAHIYTWEQNQELTFDARTLHSANLDRTLKSMAIGPSGSGIQTRTADQLALYQFNDATFSPDSKSVALVHKDEISIVDLASGKLRDAVPVLDHEVLTCLFPSNDAIVAGLLSDDSFRYDLATRVRGPFAAWGVHQFLAVPHSTSVLMNLGGRVGIKSISGTGAWAAFTSDKLADPTHVEFSPDGKELVSGINWATSPMTVWDLTSGEADTRSLPLAGVENFALSPDGKYVAYYGSEGYPNVSVHVWNRQTRQEQLSLPIKVSGIAQSIAFSADGKRLGALIGEPKAARIWSIPEGAVLATIPIVEDTVNKLVWSPTGRTMAIAQKTGIMIVDAGGSAEPHLAKTFDPQQGQQFHGFGELQFSPDGKTLATAGIGEIYLVDASTGAVETRIPNASSLCFRFSPDGARLAFLRQVIDRNLQVQPAGVALWDTAAKKVVAQDTSNSTGCPASFSRDGHFLATNRSGGSGVDIVSTDTGEVRASLLRFGNDSSMDWMVVTPDGLFDGTPGAWSQINWRFSDDTFDVVPAEVFFQEFFRPGLLADILAGREVRPLANIAQIDRRQPEVRFDTATSSSTPVTNRVTHLTLDVTESRDAKDPGSHTGGSGARDVRLFRNGTLVRVWRGEVKLDANGSAVLSADVPIQAGDNHFVAYAFNHDNVKSMDSSVTIVGAPSLERKGTAYVVAIGINQYAAHAGGQLNNLSFAEADATDFASQFKLRQDALQDFESVQIIPLMGANAVRSRIVDALQSLAGKVQPEDGVFLFYAGHGIASEGHFYLLPQDFNPKANFSDPRSHTLSEMDLSKLLEPISPSRSFLIIDACNSGQALGGDKFVPGPMNSTGLAQLAYEKGLYILAASQGHESAMESPNLGSGHGYLTYALVEEGLKTQAVAEAGTVLLRPWFEFASQRVPKLQSGTADDVDPTPQKDQAGRGLLVEDNGDPTQEGRQHPKVFYRREPEITPFIVAKPSEPQAPQTK
jgi:WD40 repeat protein